MKAQKTNSNPQDKLHRVNDHAHDVDADGENASETPLVAEVLALGTCNEAQENKDVGLHLECNIQVLDQVISA